MKCKFDKQNCNANKELGKKENYAELCQDIKKNMLR